MGDHDDGFHDVENLPVQFLLMYQQTYTDGYNRSSSGPLYESQVAADFASQQENKGYAVESKALSCVKIDGKVYIIDGPYKTIMDLEIEDEIRRAAMAKLSDVEKRALGLDGSKKP